MVEGVIVSKQDNTRVEVWPNNLRMDRVIFYYIAAMTSMQLLHYVVIYFLVLE